MSIAAIKITGEYFGIIKTNIKERIGRIVDMYLFIFLFFIVILLYFSIKSFSIGSVHAPRIDIIAESIKAITIISAVSCGKEVKKSNINIRGNKAG